MIPAFQTCSDIFCLIEGSPPVTRLTVNVWCSLGRASRSMSGALGPDGAGRGRGVVKLRRLLEKTNAKQIRPLRITLCHRRRKRRKNTTLYTTLPEADLHNPPAQPLHNPRLVQHKPFFSIKINNKSLSKGRYINRLSLRFTLVIAT